MLCIYFKKYGFVLLGASLKFSLKQFSSDVLSCYIKLATLCSGVFYFYALICLISVLVSVKHQKMFIILLYYPVLTDASSSVRLYLAKA